MRRSPIHVSQPPPGVLDIAPYVPGEHDAEGAAEIHVMSANEGALGASPKAIAAYEAVGRHLHRYPEGGATDLRAAIARHHGLEAGRVVCGSGSDELIRLLTGAYAGPGDEVLFSRHGFAMYPISALACGAKPVAAPETDLRADVDALLAAVTDQTKILFLANPNNPTGSHLGPDAVTRLHGGLPETVLLVIDAAYAEYIDRPDYEAGLDLARNAANVVMLRTFSKIHGLAALRVGWAYGPDHVADVLGRVRGPFNVNAAAQAAAATALADTDHVAKAKAHNDRWLPWLADELTALGLTAHPCYQRRQFHPGRLPGNGRQDRRGGGRLSRLARRHHAPHGRLRPAPVPANYGGRGTGAEGLRGGTRGVHGGLSVLSFSGGIGQGKGHIGRYQRQNVDICRVYEPNLAKMSTFLAQNDDFSAPE